MLEILSESKGYGSFVNYSFVHFLFVSCTSNHHALEIIIYHVPLVLVPCILAS